MQDFAGVISKVIASHHRIEMYAGLLTPPGEKPMNITEVLFPSDGRDPQIRKRRQALMGMGLIGAFGATIFSLAELGKVVNGANGEGDQK